MKSFVRRMQELGDLVREGCPLEAVHSFYGEWPEDLARIRVDPKNPVSGMLKRLATLSEHVNNSFENCSDAFIGSTMNLAQVFNQYMTRIGNKTIFMISLHEFDNSPDAMAATRTLIMMAPRMGLHVGTRSYKAEAHGPACVYARFSV